MKQNKPCMNPHILLICVHDGESSIRNYSIVVVFNRETYVIAICKNFTVIFLFCFSSFHNIDRESAYVFGFLIYVVSESENLFVREIVCCSV